MTAPHRAPALRSDATRAVARRSSRATSFRSSIRGAHLLVALAGLLGALLTLTALRDAQKTVGVLAVGREVSMGTVLRQSDLTTIDIGGDDGVLDALYRSSDSGSLIGRVVVAPIHKGDLIRRSDVRSTAASDGQRSISFALEAADAVAGAVGVGDRIDVVGVTNNGSDSGYVLTNASVLSVSNPQSSGPLRSTDRKITITVNVDPDAALRLVAAQSAGKIVVVRATGAAPQVDAAMFAPDESPAAATRLPKDATG